MKQPLIPAAEFIADFVEFNWQDWFFKEFMTKEQMIATILLVYYFNGRTAVGLDQMFNGQLTSFIASDQRLVCIIGNQKSYAKADPAICLYENISEDCQRIVQLMEIALSRALLV